MTNLRRSRIGSLFRSVKRAMTTKTDQPITRSQSPNHLTQAVSRMSRIFNPALARRSAPLPYDLMHMVLAELCSGRGGPAEILQQRLWVFPMTLVSHAWREAALPVFYHSVVCMANRNIDGTLTLQWQPKMHRKYAQECVRQLVVIVGGLGGLDDLTERLEVVRGFVNVQSLHLVLNDGPAGGRWNAGTKEQIASFNRFLASALPRLEALRYFSYVDDAFCPVFPLNLLVHMNLPRLHSLDVFSGFVPRFPEILPETYALSSLTLRSTRLEASTAAIERFRATLVYLNLSLVPVATVWQGFLLPTDCEPVEFPRLEILALKFDLTAELSELDGPESAEGEGLEALRGPAFPAMQGLRVSSYPRNIQRLLRYFPCHRLAHLQLMDCDTGLMYVNPQMLACIASVYIRAAGAPTAMQANWLAEILQAPSQLHSLHIDCTATLPLLYLDVGSVLRKLTLFVSLQLSAIERLVAGAPNLWYLCVRISDQHPYCDHQMGYKGKVSGNVVSHSLQAFAVYDPATAVQLCDRKICELVNLLARVPSLLALDMGYADTVRVLERVRAMRWHAGHMGCHLKDIDVSIV